MLCRKYTGLEKVAQTYSGKVYKENVPEEVTLKLIAKEQEILSEEGVWGECCKHRKEHMQRP